MVRTIRKIPGLSCLVFSLAIGCVVCAGAGPTRDGGERRDRKEDPYIEETVYEGMGFAGVEFGDSVERVEEVLGEPGGGSEHSLRYLDSGLEIRLYDGKVRGFSFYRRFRGKLFVSELGMGDTLENVQEAYGELAGERSVKELTDWTLDKTLLVRRDGPKRDGEAVSKLSYYDAGLYFFFDEQDQIVGFGVNRETNYARRFMETESEPE